MKLITLGLNEDRWIVARLEGDPARDLLVRWPPMWTIAVPIAVDSFVASLPADGAFWYSTSPMPPFRQSLWRWRCTENGVAHYERDTR